MPQLIHIQIHKSKQQSNIEVSKASITPPIILNHNLGLKNYELSNHLGNVTTVISDRKIPRAPLGSNTTIAYYMPDIVSATDYYPFGMTMQERSFSAGGAGYRFGFNGQEKENEINGTDGGYLVFEYRIHDARLGRFLSTDPLSAEYPWNSSYAFAENDVIRCIDLEGAEKYSKVTYNYKGISFFSDISVTQKKNQATRNQQKVTSGVYERSIALTPDQLKTFNISNTVKPGMLEGNETFFWPDINPIESSEVPQDCPNGCVIWSFNFQQVTFDENDASQATLLQQYNSDETFKNSVDIIVAVLKNNPTITVDITGNTDSKISDYKSPNANNPYVNVAGNLPLSYDRAKAMKIFLDAQAVANGGTSIANQINVNGAAEQNSTQPANSTEPQRAPDRGFILKVN